MEQHVPMTEELVEKLTPAKEQGDNDIEERNKILEGIAEVCMQQRQYHLATKKYTQSGNKAKVWKIITQICILPFRIMNW
jgi:intraflagellar transport protein 140